MLPRPITPGGLAIIVPTTATTATTTATTAPVLAAFLFPPVARRCLCRFSFPPGTLCALRTLLATPLVPLCFGTFHSAVHFRALLHPPQTSHELHVGLVGALLSGVRAIFGAFLAWLGAVGVGKHGGIVLQINVVQPFVLHVVLAVAVLFLVSFVSVLNGNFVNVRHRSRNQFCRVLRDCRCRRRWRGSFLHGLRGLRSRVQCTASGIHVHRLMNGIHLGVVGVVGSRPTCAQREGRREGERERRRTTQKISRCTGRVGRKYK